MSAKEPSSISESLKDNERLLDALDHAVHEAIRVHKLMGRPIVSWTDGKVQIIPAERIQLDDGNGGNGSLPRN